MSTSSAVTAVAAVAALASAAAAGVMVAFSTFVMSGLDRAGPASAVAAMRGINAAATSSGLFLLLYFGAALLAIAAGVLALAQWGAGSSWLLAGAVVGVIGAVVTVACNVPLNDQLDTTDIAAAAVSSVWADYQQQWMGWNHVRAASGLLAAALLTVGALRR